MSERFQIEPFESITTPNTDTMRAYSHYFQSSIGPYEGYLDNLRKHAPTVAASWQGDAASAYAEHNKQLIKVGYIHTEQMQRASQIFEGTADRFDEGNEQQRRAQAQLDAARSAEMTGDWLAVPALMAAARATHAAAQATIEAARVAFNSGFAALQAQMSSVPWLGGAYDTTFVPKSESLPELHAPNSIGLPTPPTTPLPSRPSTPVLIADLTASLPGAAKPAGTPPMTPPASRPSTPVLTDDLTPTMQETANPAETPPLTPPPPGVVTDTNAKGTQQPTAQDLTEAMKQPQPDASAERAKPPIGGQNLTGARQEAQQEYAAGERKSGAEEGQENTPNTKWRRPDSGTSTPKEHLPSHDHANWLRKDPPNPLTQALRSTPEGNLALNIDQAYGVNWDVRRGAGSSYDPATNTVTLDPNVPLPLMQKQAIHEMIHVWFAQTGRTADPSRLPQAVYVQKMLLEESVAEALAIHHHFRLNQDSPYSPLSQISIQGYQAGYEQAVKAGA